MSTAKLLEKEFMRIMKLKKIEIIALAAAVLMVTFTSGYFLGRDRSKTEINVTAGLNDQLKNDENSQGEKVNINTAGLDELVKLPGIGEVMAQRIIDYRTENGAFERIEDIVKVNGIGDGTYMEIKDYITVDTEKN